MKATLSIISIGILAFITLHAQDITGTWQGTLKGRDASQLGLKISKSDTNALQAFVYRRDQWQNIPVESLKLQGSTLTFSVQVLDSNYKGAVSKDYKSIVGVWTHDKQSQPLTFVRATPDTAWEIPVDRHPIAADVNPAFEVATIKPSDPTAGAMNYGAHGKDFFTRNTTLADLMHIAYDVQTRQIVGIPPSMEKTKYDIDAEHDPEGGTPSVEQWRQMLQKLLAERFELVVHRGKKEWPVYALMVGKNGPILTKSVEDPTDRAHVFLKPGTNGGTTIVATNVTMTDFCTVLMGQLALDRPIVDQTNMPGKFDITLNYLPDTKQTNSIDGSTPASTDPGVAPIPFEAIKEQLGLELKSTKAPVDVVVIDHVEPPSAN